jgi:hypothetical protein
MPLKARQDSGWHGRELQLCFRISALCLVVFYATGSTLFYGSKSISCMPGPWPKFPCQPFKKATWKWSLLHHAHADATIRFGRLAQVCAFEKRTLVAAHLNAMHLMAATTAKISSLTNTWDGQPLDSLHPQDEINSAGHHCYKHVIPVVSHHRTGELYLPLFQISKRNKRNLGYVQQNSMLKEPSQISTTPQEPSLSRALFQAL